MPTGVVRPYTLTDVLMTINDQVNQVQQAVTGSVTGISVVAEDDESSMTTSDAVTAVPVTPAPVWATTNGLSTWGSSVWG
jgi:hypothetical protein